LVLANWTNNNAESTNHVLKTMCDWKKINLVALVSSLHLHINAQYLELERAVYGQEGLKLAPAYTSLGKRGDDWLRMSSGAKQNVMRQ
jgi:hypothetical protein